MPELGIQHAGTEASLKAVSFRLPVAQQRRLKAACAGLAVTQQELLAAMVDTLVTEYDRAPQALRELLARANGAR